MQREWQNILIHLRQHERTLRNCTCVCFNLHPTIIRTPMLGQDQDQSEQRVCLQNIRDHVQGSTLQDVKSFHPFHGVDTMLVTGKNNQYLVGYIWAYLNGCRQELVWHCNVDRGYRNVIIYPSYPKTMCQVFWGVAKTSGVCCYLIILILSIYDGPLRSTTGCWFSSLFLWTGMECAYCVKIVLIFLILFYFFALDF